jgi:hypothetical protein
MPLRDKRSFILLFLTIFAVPNAIFLQILEFRKACKKPSFSLRQHKFKAPIFRGWLIKA